MGRRVLIITSLLEEYEAVRYHLHDVREEIELRFIYERGSFMVAGGLFWEVSIIAVSGGNAGAALETERAIQHFQPELVLLVGIAGGLRDVEVGDVVVATKIYTYEHRKTSTSFLVGQEIVSASYVLEQKARVVASAREWLKRLPLPSLLPHLREPEVYLGPIIAGETGISASSSFYNFLTTSYPDTLALEMEGNGYGFIRAIQENRSLPMLVIRGITNVIDDKRKMDYNTTRYAARHASAFAFELLATFESVMNGRAKGFPSGALPQITTSSLRPADSTGIFFAYADEDELMAQRLQTHLAQLKRMNVISSWHSGLVEAGEDIASQLAYVNTAKIILLLISPDSLYSDEFYKVSSQAMERQRTNGATVIPVLLRPTNEWKEAPFGSLRALPRGGKAVTEFKNQDEAFTEIASEIRTLSKKQASF
ncbi:MAG TPA: TIR domain-containing protein [Ktedonobacteraceae bacterium]